VRRFLILLSLFFLTSCGRVNPDIKGELSENIERIVITNTRYAGRYTIIDKKAILRFKNKIIRANKASINSNLDPDFVFDFYSGNKRVASFKYIAKINDKEVANLIDEKGNLYNVSTTIEDEFIKRLLKVSKNENVPEYYVSAINLIIEKIGAKDSVIAVDLKKEVMTLRYLTSVDIKEIFEGINKNGVKVVLKDSTKNYDYLMILDTKKYSGNRVEAEITVVDNKGTKALYKLEGNYKDKWEFFISFK